VKKRMGRQIYDAEYIGSFEKRHTIKQLRTGIARFEKKFSKTGKGVEKLRDYRRAYRLKAFRLGLKDY
jgi:hypothetical protein